MEAECSKLLGFRAPMSTPSACQSAAARRAPKWAHELNITLQQVAYQHDENWRIMLQKHC